MAYLPSLKLFLPLPSFEKFAKQANLSSHQVFVQVFLLCSSWMYFLMGLSKAINLFKLCSLFMANFRENLSKLMETLQTSVNEEWRGAKKQRGLFCKLTDSFWQLISDWMKRLFPRVRKSIHDCDWIKKFLYEFFMRSILSENLSKNGIILVFSRWRPRQDLKKEANQLFLSM